MNRKLIASSNANTEISVIHLASFKQKAFSKRRRDYMSFMARTNNQNKQRGCRCSVHTHSNNRSLQQDHRAKEASDWSDGKRHSPSKYLLLHSKSFQWPLYVYVMSICRPYKGLDIILPGAKCYFCITCPCHLGDPDSRGRSRETGLTGLELADWAEDSKSKAVDAGDSEPVGQTRRQFPLLSALVVLGPRKLPLWEQRSLVEKKLWKMVNKSTYESRKKM